MLACRSGHPARAKSFRLAFIETAKKLDPLDAAVLQSVSANDAGRVTGETQNKIAERSASLEKLNLIREVSAVTRAVSAFGREFLRTVSD
jgi:hypothetical protein